MEVIQNTFIFANLIIVQLSGITVITLRYVKWRKLRKELIILLNDKKGSYSSLLVKSRQTTLHLKLILRIATA